jgi:hypothetical protein
MNSILNKKHCKRCDILKETSEYYKNKARKDGLQTYCKSCMKKENVQNYKNHKETWDKRTKKYCKSDKNKKYRREWAKKKYHSNIEHRQKIIKQVVKYERKRLMTDKSFRLLKILRSRLRKAVKKQYTHKTDQTMNLIGCSVAFLKNHLQLQFIENMSWDNHGEWHIDHIKPCASFDLSDKKEQIMCFHYTNLQPLWGPDNLSKSDKFDEKTFNRKWDDEKGWIIISE